MGGWLVGVGWGGVWWNLTSTWLIIEYANKNMSTAASDSLISFFIFYSSGAAAVVAFHFNYKPMAKTNRNYT